MTALTFTLREPPRQRIDMSPLSPDRLGSQPRGEIGMIQLRIGNEQQRLNTLFDIEGHNTSQIVIRNACDRLDFIGAGMQSGRITIEGGAGAYLGRGMRGGKIEVRGDAGAYAASGMDGGLILVEGDAGDFLGGGAAGERQGMNRGVVVIKGNTGDHTGDRLRRGMILIEGDTGDYCGSHMIAGTIAVLGQVGRHAGYAMRRGTLLLSRAPRSLPVTFNDAGEHDLTFLTLLLSSLRRYDSRFATLDSARKRVQRYVGDLACDGQGEVLVWI